MPGATSLRPHGRAAACGGGAVAARFRSGGAEPAHDDAVGRAAAGLEQRPQAGPQDQPQAKCLAYRCQEDDRDVELQACPGVVRVAAGVEIHGDIPVDAVADSDFGAPGKIFLSL